MHPIQSLNHSHGLVLFWPSTDDDQMKSWNSGLENPAGFDEERKTLQAFQPAAENANRRRNRDTKLATENSTVLWREGFYLLADSSRVH